MKKLFLFILLSCFTFFSCVKDQHEADPVKESSSITVAEAKAAFEETMMAAAQTRNISEALNSGLLPGDFTPIWGENSVENNESSSRINVPITGAYISYAYVSPSVCTEHGGHCDHPARKGWSSKVTNRLVVVKRFEDNLITPYIQTIIPLEDTRLKKGDPLDNLTGIVKYSSVGGRWVKTEVFEKGVRVEALYYKEEKPAFEHKNEKIHSYLAGVRFSKHQALRTRATVETSIPEFNFVACSKCGWSVEYCYCSDDPWEPNDPDDPGDDDWPDPDPDPGGGGGNPPTNPPTTPTQPTANEKAQNHAKKLKNAFGDKLKQILQKTSIKISADLPGFAMAATKLNPQSIYDANVQITIILSEDLTDLQMKLLLGHEYLHLSLYQISINAGSYEQFLIDNPALADQINLRGVNSGHHNYMVSGMDEYEAILRQAFPGEPEEFYKYGKWGGGPLFGTESYFKISVEERNKIENYLKENGLL